MKCFVVSNCTHAPIREYLAATGRFEAVDSSPIFEVAPQDLAQKYAQVRDYDIVLSTILYGDRWGPFEHGAMRSDLGDRLFLFSPPFFSGLHPDLIHVARGGQRFLSPIGPYHSGLAFWGFMQGIPVPRLVAMHEAGDLPPLFDPVPAWEEALRALVAREAAADVRAADRIEALCRQRPAMLTFNHPTIAIIAELADRALQAIFGAAGAARLEPSNIHNALLADVVVPVSPAAVKAHRLPYRSTGLFKYGLVAPGRQKGYIGFERLARESYARYAQVDRAELRPTTPAPLARALSEELGLQKDAQ